jgi:hypothetical protein
MKKTRKNQIKSAIAALVLLSLQTPVFASRLTFAPQTKDAPPVLSTTLPVARLGRLTVPGGVISIDSNAVEVTAVPEGLFDSRMVLSGVVVTASAAGSRGVVRGQIYFFGGPWLNYLSLKPTFEIVEKIDGTLVSGQIVEGSEKDLTVRAADGSLTTVPFTDIINVESPRAQNFLVPFVGRSAAASVISMGEASEIRFTSAAGKSSRGLPGSRSLALKRPINAPLGDERGISNGTVGAYLAANLFWTVAPAIATPLVFGRSLAGPINRIKQANALSFPGYTGLP